MSYLLLLTLFLSTNKVTPLILKVDTMNANEMTTGEEARYSLTFTVPRETDLTVHIKLPYNNTALFTVSSVELRRIGPNIILQDPLPKPVLKAVKNNSGDNQAVWALGNIHRVSEPSDKATADEIVIGATVQAQDHSEMTNGSVHWLDFAAQYNGSSQYIVQKPITVRSGGQKFVKVDLRLTSNFQGAYSAGQTMSFEVQISHHYDSRASAKNLELIILTQKYLKLKSVNAEDLLDHTYDVTNTTGHTVIKISHLKLYQTLTFKVCMSVGVFTPNISRSKLSTNVSSSVVAELHYHGAPPEICQQDPPVVIVVKTLDYKIRPVFPQASTDIPSLPLIETLKPEIKCSSCGFSQCCVRDNVKINSSSYWMPFKVEDKQQFLEFDFHTAITLKEISLQGSGKAKDAFVKTFSLMPSNDGIRWTTQLYRGKKQVYDGNVDADSVVTRKIKPVIKARYIRIIPLTWYKRVMLRLEFFAKPGDIETFQILSPTLGRCVGNDGGNALHLVQCNSSHPLDRWVWTKHGQLQHIRSGRCLATNDDGKNVELFSCQSSSKAQKWHCHRDKFLVPSEQQKALHLVPNEVVSLTPLENTNEDDIVKIYSNKKSVCSEKGDPHLPTRQMLWNKGDRLFVCDLSSRSEETANHCLFTKDNGITWEDLDVELFKLMGVEAEKYYFYGSSFSQKNVLKFYHYGYTSSRRILKPEWEKMNSNNSLMQLPVNIPFIPFGESPPESEQPENNLTLRSSGGTPEWGASSVGIHRYIEGQWQVVLSWSKLGTRYARPGSCWQILAFGQSTGDGIYTIYPAHPLAGIKVYCDMTRNNGGWTLLLTSKTAGWNVSQVLEHNPAEPSISQDYSILKHADDIKEQSELDCFKYRLEAKEFGRFGGIWRAPKSYTFVARNNSQTNVLLVNRFGEWVYDDRSVEKRMPWICENSAVGLLTTSILVDSYWFGTLVSSTDDYSNLYNPAPWMNNIQDSPGVIWYWVREGECL